MDIKKLRKWNRNTHRDLGYFFFFLTVIYAFSGIALNHKVVDKWNAEYIVNSGSFKYEGKISKNISKDSIISILKTHNISNRYKKHYARTDKLIKVFVEDGTVVFNNETHIAEFDLLRRRPVFFESIYLHYNPNYWWTVISDIYAFALILLAITGLFILRGKNGIMGRGLWLTLAGILLPIIFLMIFL